MLTSRKGSVTAGINNVTSSEQRGVVTELDHRSFGYDACNVPFMSSIAREWN